LFPANKALIEKILIFKFQLHAQTFRGDHAFARDLKLGDGKNLTAPKESFTTKHSGEVAL